MKMENVIGKIIYYGGAVTGGVSEAVKYDLTDTPDLTLHAFVRISAAAFISAGVAALGKEVINAGIAWAKRNVTSENIRAAGLYIINLFKKNER